MDEWQLAERAEHLEAEYMASMFDLAAPSVREGLGMEVDLSLPAERVIRALDQIIEWRGKPRAIRCDNGPEYVSAALSSWAERHGIRIEHIQPGKPQQNAYIERYNRTVRYDWLSHYLFDSIDEVQDFATQWLWTYNHERPNMALGGITPKQKLAIAAWPLLLETVEKGGITCSCRSASVTALSTSGRSWNWFGVVVN